MMCTHLLANGWHAAACVLLDSSGKVVNAVGLMLCGGSHKDIGGLDKVCEHGYFMEPEPR